MKLTLISVSEPNIYPQSFRRFVHTANLVLPVLASLTPAGINVKMIDEAVYVKRPDYQKLETDLAALSVRTSCANRAYEISDLLRSRGIKTVLGGVHPTVLPEESKKHADAVVIGEAEPVWSEVIKDFRHHRLKSFYKGQVPPDLKNLPIPKRNLLQFPNRALISFSTVQTSRGCPHNCSYCSVTRVYGGKYRKRPVAEIIKELNMLKNSKHLVPNLFSSCQDWLFFFLDDNLFTDSRYVKELLRKLQPLKKKWYSQAPISVAKDMELLKLAKLAGCLILAIGFESVVRDSLTQVNKTFNNPDFYYDAVKRIHGAGIMVGASFVLGFDEDDASVFERTLRFTMQSGVDLASFHILTPYPGTPFFRQVVKENRLLVPFGNWQKFDTQHVVFRPKNMDPEQLQEGFNWLWRKFSSLKSIRQRAKFTPNTLFFWPLNLFQNALFTSSLVKLKSIAQ
jgi:radical SAM superfamily enzyme YgiQ (UPF0313 family)